MLDFQFEKGQFGPYADNLRHVLKHIEGHFIEGFADGKNSPNTPIKLRADAVEEAHRFLQQHAATREQFERVARLIDGFETPFGMELLSSVHWIATQECEAAKTDVNVAIAGVHAWTERKQRTMHARSTFGAYWQRLHEQGWI